MAWIEMHQSLPTHRKTLALADALNIEPVYAVGHLACLWMWALDNAPDGNLADVTARTIARAAQWKRNPEKLVAALTESGFVEDGRIHDWPDYAGRLLERRRRDADRKRTERASPPDVPPPSNGRPKDIPTTSGSSRAHITVPNPTVPNRTQPETYPPEAPPAAAEGAAHAEPVPTTKRAKRVAGERTPISAEALEELVVEYGEMFPGGTPAARLAADRAMNNQARLKALDERHYVQNWLRSDLERLKANGHTARAVQDVPRPQQQPVLEPCPECNRPIDARGDGHDQRRNLKRTPQEPDPLIPCRLFGQPPRAWPRQREHVA